jgi:outer membrane autotransporter protein
MLAGGYDLKKGNFTFGPTTSLQYTFFDAFPITETGAGNLDFSSTSWYNASLLYSLGGHVACTWQMNRDILVVPQISLSWQHEFLQDPYTINGTSPVPVNSTTPLRDTLYTGVGFTVEFYRNWNTSLFYNASAANQDLVSQNIFWSAGVKF